MNLKSLSLLLALGISVAAPAAKAIVVYIDAGAGSSVQDFLGGNYVAGSEFTLSSSLQIDALGYLDVQGDGFDGDHLVGLWRTSDLTLIAQANVTSASTQHLSAQGTAVWYLQSIGTTLTLGPGTYRVAGLVGSEADADALSDDKIASPGLTISQGYVRTDFPNGGFAFPNLSFGSEAIRSTIALTGAPVNQVPDSSATFSLLGLALGGLGLLRRSAARRR
jgi:hypothetical protein